MNEDEKILKALSKAYFLVMGKYPTDMDDKIIKAIYESLKITHKTTSTNAMLTALRNGCDGKYGISFRFSYQAICYWLRDGNKERL